MRMFDVGMKWYTISPDISQPSPRRDPQMAYDPARRVVLIYGGEDGRGPIRELAPWEWTGSWFNMRANDSFVASPMAGGSLTCDAGLARCTMFGGKVDTTNLANVTYLHDGDTGFKHPGTTPPFNVSNPPGARQSMCGMADQSRGITTIFGGLNQAGARLRETWTLDTMSWIQETFASPSARAWPGCTYLPATRGGVGALYGGSTTATAASAELWYYVPTDTDECLVPTSTRQTRTVQVSANGSAWVDTGVALSACQRYTVTVNPTQTIRVCTSTACQPVAAAGTGQDLRQFGCTPGMSRCGALLGAVSPAAPPSRGFGQGIFLPGTDAAPKVATSAGRLFLKVDDFNIGDNTGAFDVRIDY
jgi:hypothetical protein